MISAQSIQISMWGRGWVCVNEYERRRFLSVGLHEYMKRELICESEVSVRFVLRVIIEWSVYSELFHCITIAGSQLLFSWKDLIEFGGSCPSTCIIAIISHTQRLTWDLKLITNQPSIHWLHRLMLAVIPRSWWLSQGSLGKRCGTPWTQCQSIMGWHRDRQDKDSSKEKFIPKGKPEVLERNLDLQRLPYMTLV